MSIFSKVPAKKPQYSKFKLSHERKMSINFNNLYPCYVQEIIPGDRFRMSSQVMLRMAPMLAPVMHRNDVFIHHFFVPNRLVWDEWEKFITGGEDGTAAPVHPFYEINEASKLYFLEKSLSDYMGCPTVEFGPTIVNPLRVSALPFRAYTLIWNEYFRDENLDAAVDIAKNSGYQNPGGYEVLALRQRCWEKDYFTSALPFAQRGPAVRLPIENEVDWGYKAVSDVIATTGGTPAPAGSDVVVSSTTPGQLNAPNGNLARIENIDDIEVDSTSVTMNELTRAQRLQEWLEKMARGGARYVEQIWQHFKVRSSDARLQRPEYLGGGRVPVVMSEVVSTFGDPDNVGEPQGNMAGHGIAVGGANGFTRRFEEHGYIISVMSVRPRTAYQQGLPKHFSRFDKLDYAWPSFAHLGEEPIKLKELWYDPTSTDPAENEEDFGYTPRYASYKFTPSTVHGEFRSGLSFWHEGRIFQSKPFLSAEFVRCDATDRIFAVQDDTDKMYVQLYNRVDALRPLPYFGEPRH